MSSTTISECDGTLCSKKCEEHVSNNRRIEELELKYKICEENSINIGKLTGKITILILIMSLSVTIVSMGALYTFTGLNTFKDVYSDDLMQTQQNISNLKYSNSEKIQQSIYNLEHSMNIKFDKVNDKLTAVEKLMVKKHDV